ncbi:MAG: TetR/AcrR family transcriptional regulator [Actinomycetota bacterium]
MTTTADRIADTALRLFNQKGYPSTTLTEIAAEIGISQGNLTYHFPTKLDLALHFSEQVRLHGEKRRANHAPGDIADDYLESLHNAMQLTWTYGFLMRDRGIFEPADAVVAPSPILVAALAERQALIERIAEEGLFRADADVDVEVLSRSLWILSRHWADHLREMEAKADLEWTDMQRGIDHHLAVLSPMLTAAGRRRFRAACDRAGWDNSVP